MARYYFHLDNGDGHVRDENGLDLPNDAEARRHAIDASAAIIADEIRDGCQVIHLVITIEHAERGIVDKIPITVEIGRDVSGPGSDTPLK